MIKVLLISLLLSISLLADYEKITVSKKFFSEGCAYGDINGDGINDIVAGSFWWEGPKFRKKYQIRELAN